MKKILFIICVAFISCEQPYDRTERADVIRILDGDTFDVRTENGQLKRIRMAYMDAPELSQHFGLAAHYILDSVIGDKQVMLYKLDVDKYGRIVAIVHSPNIEQSVNVFMVDRGYGWVYPQYAPLDMYQKHLIAKAKRKGMWQNPYPISPYEYRKQHNHE